MKFNRVISLIVSLVMVFTVVPVWGITANAEDESVVIQRATTCFTYNHSNGMETYGTFASKKGSTARDGYAVFEIPEQFQNAQEISVTLTITLKSAIGGANAADSTVKYYLLDDEADVAITDNESALNYIDTTVEYVSASTISLNSYAADTPYVSEQFSITPDGKKAVIVVVDYPTHSSNAGGDYYGADTEYAPYLTFIDSTTLEATGIFTQIPGEIYVIEGNKPVLPTQVELTTNAEGTTIKGQIEWDLQELSIGENHITGIVSKYGFTAETNIIVYPKTIEFGETENNGDGPKLDFGFNVYRDYYVEFDYTPTDARNNWVFITVDGGIWNQGRAGIGTPNGSTSSGMLIARSGNGNGGTTTDQELTKVTAGNTYRVFIKGNSNGSENGTFSVTVTDSDGNVYKTENECTYRRNAEYVNSIMLAISASGNRFKIDNVKVYAPETTESTVSVRGGTVTVDGEEVELDSDGKVVVKKGKNVVVTADEGIVAFEVNDVIQKLDENGTISFVTAEDVDIFGYTLGVTLVDGAQVRIGKGVWNDTTDEHTKDKIKGNSGLRFIATVSYNDSIAALEGAVCGMRITAQDSSENSYVDIDAEKYQDGDEKTIFTAALVDLAESNYNRVFTATPYVKLNDEIYLGKQTVSRSIYEVSAGLLVNNTIEGNDNDKYAYEVNETVLKVLNAYVNTTGVRLFLKKNNEEFTVEAMNGSWSGNGNYYGGKVDEEGNPVAPEVFFEAETISAENYVFVVKITPVNNAKILDYWDEYIRLNNSKVGSVSSAVKNDDGSLTITIDVNSLINK